MSLGLISTVWGAFTTITETCNGLNWSKRFCCCCVVLEVIAWNKCDLEHGKIRANCRFFSRVKITCTLWILVKILAYRSVITGRFFRKIQGGQGGRLRLMFYATDIWKKLIFSNTNSTQIEDSEIADFYIVSETLLLRNYYFHGLHFFSQSV